MFEPAVTDVPYGLMSARRALKSVVPCEQHKRIHNQSKQGLLVSAYAMDEYVFSDSACIQEKWPFRTRRAATHEMKLGTGLREGLQRLGEGAIL